MAEQSQPPANQRFKAEMPQIPGLSGPGPRPAGSGGHWLVVSGCLAVLLAALVGGKFLSKPHRADPPPASTAQIDVPATPDLPAPVAVDANGPVAKIEDMTKPWTSMEFTFHNPITGENVPALLLRLPQGSTAQSSGYWAFAMRAPFSNCRLEYLQDLDKLKSDYSYNQARHPMVGNPCSRTVYDPLKYATISGNVLARGAIAQGSDLRPPLGIEIKIRGKDILATRME